MKSTPVADSGRRFAGVVHEEWEQLVRFVIHIGTEKTGTTSLQSMLHLQRAVLQDRGFHFVRSPGHRNNRWLPSAFISDDNPDDFVKEVSRGDHETWWSKREDFFARFRAEMGSLEEGTHTVVVSSEHFHSRLTRQDEVDDFRDFIREYASSVEIVCYVRPQVDTCISLFSTSLRVGQVRSFEQFLETCHPDNIYYNYFRMLGMWADAFGRDSVVVREFSREKLQGGSILDDFISYLSPELLDVVDRTVDDVNESINPIGQALLLSVNRYLSADGGYSEASLRLQRTVMRYIARALPGKGDQPSPEQHERIQARFADANARLAAEYFPAGESIFDTSPREAPVVKADEKFVEAQVNVFSLLSEFEKLGSPDGRIADLLRDQALALECEGRMSDAYRLMRLAAVARPQGPRIRQKLVEYEQQIRGNA